MPVPGAGDGARSTGSGLRSITTRLIVTIAGAGALVFGAVLWKDAIDTRALLTEETKSHARTAAYGIASNLRAIVHRVEAGARGLATTVATTDPERDEIHELLKQLVHDDGGQIVLVFNNLIGAYSTKLAHGEIAPNWEFDGLRIAERWWFA